MFSLIIPVYNVDNYLRRCLDSCLNQDYDMYEIICIDDGSTDNSGYILDEYHRRFMNIVKVIHTENHGVSEARNCGIKHAKGQYCWFIDPDDIIEKNLLKDIVSLIQHKDLVLLSYKEQKENGGQIRQKSWPSPNDFEQKDFTKYATNHQFDKVWNYVVRKEILLDNKLYFGKHIVVGEDKAFDFFLSQYINNWTIYDKPSYTYMIQEHSASKGHNINDKYRKRMIENSYWTALFYKMNSGKCKNEQFADMALQQQYANIRSVINNTVKYGDREYLADVLNRLKNNNMYPNPIRLKDFKRNLHKYILSIMFNVPVIAKTSCYFYVIKKRLKT